MLKKKIISALLAGITALSLTACGGNTSQADVNTSGSAETKRNEELTTVRYAVMTNTDSQWYAVIGKETGIFEKHGINLEITEFATGVNTVDAIVTEQADIGYMGDYAVVNRIGNTQDSSNLRIFSRISTNSGKNGAALYVNPDKVKSLKDLADQGFATLPGTVGDYWVAKTYKEAGISKEHQKVLNCDSSATAVAILTSGDGVALWTSGPDAKKLKKAGFKPLISLDKIGLHTENYNITSTSYITEHKDIIEKFILAEQDIIKWIGENPDEAAKIIESKTGNPADQFLDSLDATTLTIDFTKDTLEHLNGIKDWAVANGTFKDYDILDYAELSALEEAIPGSVTVKK